MSKFYFKNPEKKQKEIAYILYMMISSYYNQAVCKNPVMEKNLLLYYKEMTSDAQIRMEERILREADRTLKPYLETLRDSKCVVGIHRGVYGYEIRFQTGFEEVVAKVDAKNRFQIKVIHEADCTIPHLNNMVF